MLRCRRATSDSRFQLTSDGLRTYAAAVDAMLSDRVEFAQLIKLYSQPQTSEQRYSQARTNWCRIHGGLRVTTAMEAGITNPVWDDIRNAY